MFGSLALEVGIGLFLFFLLFSLLCTALQEMISSLFALRFRNLQQGLIALLDDPDLVEEILESPAITRLMHPRARDRHRKQRERKKVAEAARAEGERVEKKRQVLPKRGPSYMPSDVFVAALLETLQRREKTKAKDEAAKGTPASDQADPQKGELVLLPGYDLYRDARQLIENIPDDNPMKQSLLLALTRAGTDAEAVQQELRTWFNQTMERVSGWYRRQVKLIIFCIAAVLAIGLNANAIQIAIALATNQQLRDSVVSSAETVIDVIEPSAGTAGSDGGGNVVTEQPADAVQTTAPNAGAAVESAIALFPIGWGDECALAMFDAAAPAGNCGPWWVNLIEAIGGWLATIAAASLGAPFWFNLLDKMLTIRGSGNPQPTTNAS